MLKVTEAQSVDGCSSFRSSGLDILNILNTLIQMMLSYLLTKEKYTDGCLLHRLLSSVRVLMCVNLSSFKPPRTLFTSWSRADQRLYEIPGLSADMMQLIIEFAYTGHVALSEDSVQDLLLAADQLIVIQVIQACWDFLEERLSPENCIGVWHFTSVCHCPKLHHKAYHYIISNFEEVALGEELLHLSVDHLTEIIAKDELNVRNERSVFKAIHQWISFAPEERQNHLASLLSKVCLTHQHQADIESQRCWSSAFRTSSGHLSH